MSSKTIDQRVVEMRFDNQQFERGVETSMSTLDKLKKALNFSGATKGLDDMSAAAKGVNFTPLSNAIDSVQRGFSALEVIGVTALANITNSAVNAGKRIASALTIEPIKTGFQEYETQINATQTILANTQKEGATIEDVNKALDELNKYADLTIYNFTEMTRNIGTFTAAGVDLKTSVSAIQGIANLAAISGSTSQQASTAMYQLSQALASGTVKLMDWNSVVNAGMGGQVFQDALKETARLHGVVIDQMIEEEGSFRETLKNGWLTADILTETLSKFTTSGVNEYLAEHTSLSKEDIEAMRNEATASKDQTAAFKEMAATLEKNSDLTSDQIYELLNMSQTAEEAATKVKTFTQLWDVLKEAAQSGWSQTWRIIVGDFEEAKSLLTEISDTLTPVINASADARNNALNDWKDLGGRAALVDSMRNIFEGLGSAITPVKEALTDIFPPITGQQLMDATEKLRDLTEKFKMTDETANNLKSTFKGVFSVFSIAKQGIEAVAKGLLPLGEALFGVSWNMLSFTASIGEGLSGLDEALKKTKGLSMVTEVISSAITKAISLIQKLIGGLGSAGEATEVFKAGVSGAAQALDDLGAKSKVLAFFRTIGELIGSAASSLASLAGKGFGKLKEMLNGIDLSRIANLIDTLSFAALSAGIVKFVGYLRKPLEELGSIKKSVVGVIDAVGDRISAMEKSVNAKSLLIVAGAIGILAASLLVLSSIDEKRLSTAMGSITVLFAELVGAFAMVGKLGSVKGTASMVLISTSLLILASALKKISDLSPMELATGITGIAGSMLLLFTVLSRMPNDFTRTGGSFLVLATGLRVFASAMSAFGKMSAEELITSFTALGGSLLLLSAAIKQMPKNMAGTGAGLLIVATALGVLALSLRGLGSMSWEQMAKGLITMGVALAILAVGLKAMSGTIGGSASLVVASAALAIMAPALAVIGSLSIASIGKALLVLAGSFTILGIAGAVLAPVVPVILGLAGAFALVGLAVLGIGTGLLAAGTGLSALAAGLIALAGISVGAAASIASSITIIGMAAISLIPMIIEKIGEGIVAFCVAIGNGAVAIGEAFQKIIVVIADVVLTTLVEYTPQIVDLLFDFLIEVLNRLADRMPEFVSAVMKVAGALFQSIGDAIRAIDTETMLQDLGIIALITGLIVGLSVIGPMIPEAMVALIGVAAFIAELSLLLAAMGAINQIPGLNWLIGEGGKLLETVGTAIGGFVGGIVGGFMSGVSSQFPKIGKDLAGFMTNVKPFIEGAKTIDFSVLKGVTQLSAAILVLTGAELLSGIASWFSGKSSLTSFAQELIPFGQAMKKYSETVAGMDGSVVSASANAAKAIVELANNLPKQGGVVGWFTGKNDMASFGENLVTFGKRFSEYALEIQNVDTNVVSATSSATSAIVEISNAIPKTGLFSGNTSIADFGMQLSTFGYYFNDYYNYVSAIDTAALSAVTTEMNNLVAMAKGMTDVDTSRIGEFGTTLKTLGSVGLDNFTKAFTGATDKIQDAAYTLTDKFLTAATSKQTSFISTFNKLADSCVKALRQYYSDFYHAGAYLVQGFANGISANTYLAEARARAMAAAAAAAARKELQVNSPSKVGYEIGDFFGLGFVNAIDAYQRYAYDSAANMGDSAKSGLTAAATKIQNALDSDLDMQPVIRPVLDLSSIQAGSRYLNGLIPQGGIQTIRGAELSSRISTSFGGEGSVNPKIQNGVTTSSSSSTTNTFNIYGTNAQEIAQEVSKILNQQVQRRERAWA